MGRAEQFELADGVWPTMLTPFDEAGGVDWRALDELIEWYIGHGVSGLFAVCQSSEMFSLSLQERVELSRYCVTRANGRCGVIASGHISAEPSAQLEEMQEIARSGVEAVVLVTNRLAAQEESDRQWQKRAEWLMDQLDVPLGLYECPAPYKRLLSEELIKWVNETGRFRFLKDTCCNRATQRRRSSLAGGGELKLFNAHSASLLHSLNVGYSGYSGVMANFHPELYVRLQNLVARQDGDAERLQDQLGLMAMIEEHGYPANAKRYLQLEGLPIRPVTRVKDWWIPDAWEVELEELQRISASLRDNISISSDTQ